MQKLRAATVTQVLQRGNQRIQVVPVDGADVVQAELFKNGGRHDQALGVLFQLLGQLEQRRRVAQYLLGAFTRGGVEAAGHQARQVAVECPHRRRDRHVVVIEHDQHVCQTALVRHARVVQSLEGHACRHRAIADDGHGLARLAAQLRTDGHAQRRRDRGRRVRRAKGVVLALVTARKAAHAAQLAQRRHAVAPARQDLVGVGLVTHVPHQAVARRVEHVVQRDGELHCAQVGRQVPAGARHVLQQIVAQLHGQLLELGARQPLDVGGGIDPGQQGMTHGGDPRGRTTHPMFWFYVLFSDRGARCARPMPEAGRRHPIPGRCPAGRSEPGPAIGGPRYGPRPAPTG